MLEHACVCASIHTFMWGALSGLIRLSGLLLYWQRAQYADSRSAHQSQGSARRSRSSGLENQRVAALMDKCLISHRPSLRPLTLHHYGPTAQTRSPALLSFRLPRTNWGPSEGAITSQCEILNRAGLTTFGSQNGAWWEKCPTLLVDRMQNVSNEILNKAHGRMCFISCIHFRLDIGLAVLSIVRTNKIFYRRLCAMMTKKTFIIW